ncbi:MAG TPA: dihydrolipoyllysine-residue acetyltransferase [Candidatus Binataceae bacterium]
MGNLVEIKLPDIGDFNDVDVIEIMVKPGDEVRAEQSLITIESDKATTEVPSPSDGVVKELKVGLGDKVSEGSPILVLEVETQPPGAANGDAASANGASQGEPAPTAAAAKPAAAPALKTENAAAPIAARPAPFAEISSAAAPLARELPSDGAAGEHRPHASPSVRKFARELGVDLSRVKGTGLHGRIFHKDVEQFVKAMLSAPAAGGAAVALDLIPWPKVDFSRFGEIETRPLARIRKISKANLARNWVMIPHVTQFDEADVTELEALRTELNRTQSNGGVKVTMLAFVLKALVPALVRFPEFNASLEGDNLILKKYFNFGFAVDTPDGLVVPVLREVDKKGVIQIARETAQLAAVARERKLKPTDLQGGCISVSSLGGIGGTAFTPIINAPEVAIIGLSRLTHKPVYRDGGFVPRLILPLSLSYDHRVIDGATAARFIIYLSSVLNDMRRALL